MFSTHLYADSLDKNNAGIADMANGTINNKINGIGIIFPTIQSGIAFRR